MFVLPILLAVLVAIGFGVHKVVTKGRGSDHAISGAQTGNLPIDAERVFLHVLSFAGLMGALYAIAGFISLFIITVSQQSSAVLSSSDARTRPSYYLAALIIGGPLWLACWTLLQRRLSRSPEECNAFERRLFLAAVFAVASVVALFGLQTALRAMLSLPGASDKALAVRDMIVGCAQLLVWGSTWLAYARLGWAERSGREQDGPHDVAVYVLSAFALTFTTIGLWEGIRELVSTLTTANGAVLVGGSSNGAWSIWSSIAAWVLAGGGVWAAISRYDIARGGRRMWRVLYLYLALMIAVPTALAGGTDTLYELLRRAFGYHPDGSSWLFLRDALPPLLIGTVFWAYHWTVIRRNATLTEVPNGTIPWPRRPAIALLTLAGLATAAPALTYLLWLGLDSLRRTGATLAGADWWRDGASFSLAAGIVGGGAWLAAWWVLQQAAVADPMRERHAPERRRLIGLIVMISTLATAGFGVACLWEIFQVLLGASHDSSTGDWILRDASAVLVAAALAAYHGRIFRQEQRPRALRTAPMRLVALVQPGGEEVLAELTRLAGQPIEITGYLRPGTSGSAVGVAALAQQLALVQADAANDNGLLILGPSGGTLYSFTKARAQTSPRESTVSTDLERGADVAGAH